jgi:hypothetical protein
MALQTSASQITAGIVESISSRFKANVNLARLIDRKIDLDLAVEDAYWQYYRDCDRWQVSFNCSANQIVRKRVAFQFMSRQRKQLERQFAAAWSKFRRIEFEMTETLPAEDCQVFNVHAAIPAADTRDLPAWRTMVIVSKFFKEHSILWAVWDRIANQVNAVNGWTTSVKRILNRVH